MLKSSNSFMFVATAAKIVVPSFLLTCFFGCLQIINNASMLIVMVFFFIVCALKQFYEFYQKPSTLIMIEKSCPDFCISLIASLFLIPFLIYLGGGYSLLFFPFACVIFSFCYGYFKMPRTGGNKAGGEDKNFKFKGGKDYLKFTPMNLAFLIFLLCSLVFGASALHLKSVSSTSLLLIMFLSVLFAFGNLQLVFLGVGKIKKLTNKSDKIRRLFCLLIIGQAEMFVGAILMLDDKNRIGISIILLLLFYILLLFVINIHQKFIDISRKTHLPVDENIVQNKLLPENI